MSRSLIPILKEHEGGLGNVSSCRNCKALIVLVEYGWTKPRSMHSKWNPGRWITRWEDRNVPCPA